MELETQALEGGQNVAGFVIDVAIWFTRSITRDVTSKVDGQVSRIGAPLEPLDHSHHSDAQDLNFVARGLTLGDE